MVEKPTTFQKMLLRWAWANRQAVPMTFEMVVRREEIRGYDAHGQISSHEFQTSRWEPDLKDWYDLDDVTVLATSFDVTYQPTVEQCFGLRTPANELIESRQHDIAERIVHDAMLGLDFDLATWEMYGPSSWSGMPHFIRITLQPAGVELAQRLQRELTPTSEPPYRLDAETQSQYRQELARRGIALDDAKRARQLRETSGSDQCSHNVGFFVSLLAHEDPGIRLAGVRALFDIGPPAASALPALVAMRVDPDRVVRMMVEPAIERIDPVDCGAPYTGSQLPPPKTQTGIQDRTKGLANGTRSLQEIRTFDQQLARAQQLTNESQREVEAGHYHRAADRLQHAGEICLRAYAEDEAHEEGRVVLPSGLRQYLATLGDHFWRNKECDPAERMFRMLHTLTNRACPCCDDPEDVRIMFGSLGMLGRIASFCDDYALARRYHERALALHDTYAIPLDPTSVALTMADLAGALLRQGNVPWTRGMLTRLDKKLADVSPSEAVAIRLNDLGFALFEAGQLPEAGRWLEKSLAMQRHLEANGWQGPQHMERTLSHLGRTLFAMRDYQRAKVYFQQLLTLQRALYPPATYLSGHDHLVATLSHLGTIQQTIGDFSSARAYCEETFATHARLHPEGESAETDAARTILLANLESVLSAAKKGL